MMGDYCFLYTHLSDLYIFIAHRYVRIDDTDTALDCFEKGLSVPPTWLTYRLKRKCR